MSRPGAVVIGRNEGERLPRALASVLRGAEPVVYVDSGSGDASAEIARRMGAEVVELDGSAAFSAARGRNAGFQRLVDIAPQVELVQFLDGDSELSRDWLAEGSTALCARLDAGAVCGRMRERFPRRSLFHRLRDAGMDRRIGEIRGAGGTLLLRAGAFGAVGGFDEAIAAGEDYDLCFRLRRRGWKTLRIAGEMALHDSGDIGAREWWKRAERDGRAYAHVVALHWRDPERLWVREWASIWLWGGVLPLATAVGTALAGPLASVALLAYPALFGRTYRGLRRRGLDASDARWYAAACVVGKFPQMIGQARFLSRSPVR